MGLNPYYLLKSFVLYLNLMDFFLSNYRQFTPVNPKKEDEELQAYQDHLERTYRLCRVCEAKVRQVLGEQDSKLKQKFLAWKLALFR